MIYTMIYGRGEIETLEDRRDARLRGEPVEACGERLMWTRRPINHVTSCRGGYTLGFLNGSSGWYPEGNVRNFVRVEQVGDDGIHLSVADHGSAPWEV